MNEMANRFVRAASEHASSIAVRDQGNQVSYAELLDLAQRFSALFSQFAQSPRVLLALAQSPEAYAAELGSLMAGGTYCPVDPTIPVNQIRDIVELFDPHVICTVGNPDWAGSRCLASPADGRSLKPKTTIMNAAEHAYVIFTSGSTGSPKGVIIRSRSLPPFFDWLSSEFQVSPNDRWAQFSRLGFDLSIVDIFGALTSGASLVPVTRPTDRLLPGRFIERELITIWHSIPSIIPAMVEQRTGPSHAMHTLRLATFCGEPFHRYYLDLLFTAKSSLRVFNTYGPTEGTLFCSFQELDVSTCSNYCRDTVTIGRPIPGWHFVTEAIDPPGDENVYELAIAGEFIGAGYLGGTPEDAARFVDIQLGDNKSPAYRTGDTVRAIADNLYFEGRRDRQVKVRGHRLELGEVEAALLAFGAKEAHAFLVEGSLSAAVEWVSDRDDRDIRQRLAERLPPHAIPVHVISIEVFPRLSSGKIDYGALRIAVKRVTA